MCVQIDLPDRTIESCGELAELVGGMTALVRHPVYAVDPVADACLCGVDVPATMLAAGYQVEKTAWGYEARKAVAE